MVDYEILLDSLLKDNDITIESVKEKQEQIVRSGFLPENILTQNVFQMVKILFIYV